MTAPFLDFVGVRNMVTYAFRYVLYHWLSLGTRFPSNPSRYQQKLNDPSSRRLLLVLTLTHLDLQF